MGKNPQCVRGPCRVQLRVQKMIIRPNPNQPCKGSLVFSFSIRLVSIFVVIPQVYTDKIICRTKLIKSLEKDLNPMDKLPRIHPEDELSSIIIRLAMYFSSAGIFYECCSLEGS